MFFFPNSALEPKGYLLRPRLHIVLALQLPIEHASLEVALAEALFTVASYGNGTLQRTMDHQLHQHCHMTLVPCLKLEEELQPV